VSNYALFITHLRRLPRRLTSGQFPVTNVSHNHRGWRSARPMIDDRPPSVTEWTVGHVTMIMWLGISRRRRRQNGVMRSDRRRTIRTNTSRPTDRRTKTRTEKDRDGKAIENGTEEETERSTATRSALSTFFEIILRKTFAYMRPGPKFTDDQTIFALTTILWKLANSQNTYNNRKTYLKTKYYDHLLDVLRQRLKFTDRPVGFLRFILRYVVR